MKLETVRIQPIIDKPFHFLLYPWRKYNEFFDKGCRNIWGLSPIIKFTYIYFGLIIPYFFISEKLTVSTRDSIELFFTIGTIAILLIWALYMPILILITLSRAYKKAGHAVKELNTTLSEKPWEMTPKKLYTQSHSIFFLYLIYAKNCFIDFADWCTQFFLFDFIYPDRIRYPLTKKIRHNSRHIEGLIADMNIPLKYVGFEVNMQNTNYKFEFYESVRNIKKAVEKLDKGFKKTEYYVREESENIIVVAPHHLY